MRTYTPLLKWSCLRSKICIRSRCYRQLEKQQKLLLRAYYVWPHMRQKHIKIDMFLFGKFPIPFWIKINFDKRTVIKRQVLTNKTDAIKLLLENYLNNLCQNPLFGWFSFSWYSIRVLFVSVNLCSAINCNCCAWSICLSFSLICDFK